MLSLFPYIVLKPEFPWLVTNFSNCLVFQFLSWWPKLPFYKGSWTPWSLLPCNFRKKRSYCSLAATLPLNMFPYLYDNSSNYIVDINGEKLTVLSLIRARYFIWSWINVSNCLAHSIYSTSLLLGWVFSFLRRQQCVLNIPLHSAVRKYFPFTCLLQSISFLFLILCLEAQTSWNWLIFKILSFQDLLSSLQFKKW